jgi:hypothetical protein
LVKIDIDNSNQGGWIIKKKYIVRLTDAEREELHELVKKRGVAAQRRRRAMIL